jgi:hypothetical protein
MICHFCNEDLEGAAFGYYGNKTYLMCPSECSWSIIDEQGNLLIYSMTFLNQEDRKSYRLEGIKETNSTHLFSLRKNDTLNLIMSLNSFLDIKSTDDIKVLIPRLLKLKAFS